MAATTPASYADAFFGLYAGSALDESKVLLSPQSLFSADVHGQTH
jgi:hypothetical protein